MTEELSSYIATALGRDIPPAVAEKGKHHVLDTVAAMISGSRLLPGQKAIRYVETLGGVPESTVFGTALRTSAVNAALANGILGHADESDDSHAPSGMHPGCSIVPAAIAMAERCGRSGDDLLRAVVLGYDIGTRLNFALGTANMTGAFRSTHAIGGLFGSAAAAGALAGLSAREIRYLLDYTAQQASGVTYWVRDNQHVEKAFVFGGMPARNAVAAATMVASGYTGVDDCFSGDRNFLQAFSPAPDSTALVRGLGSQYEIMRTNIKKWPVGSPIQAAIDSLQAVVAENKVNPGDIERIKVRLPVEGARTVDNRHMPDICLQHVMALVMVDGTVTFDAVQDYNRMQDPEILSWRNRVELAGDEELSAAKPARQGIVELILRDGTHLSHRTYAVRGTSDNPMDRQEVSMKSVSLTTPVLGRERAERLASALLDLENVIEVTALRHLFVA